MPSSTLGKTKPGIEVLSRASLQSPIQRSERNPCTMAGGKKQKKPRNAAPASPRRQIVLALPAPGQFGRPIQEPAPAPDAAPVVAAAAEPERGSQEKQQKEEEEEVTFEQKHDEFREAAADLAADFGVDVNAYIFLPGGQQAVHDFFPGDFAAVAARQHAAEVRESRKRVVDLLRKDVNQMNLEEAKAHRAQLDELMADCERELQLQENRAAGASTSAAADGP
ncbi:hypothetical protein BRADI_3g14450v3 [Brachypodium distachyon]|uniref:Uncharacterized protein n=1 Tax=Brachypodium distachyon TaxID=15368 RepID=A0A0Q3LR03_BRADI|nr:hypothetical protein BRADI_3g14450v3 [Brachypodium distachyon]